MPVTTDLKMDKEKISMIRKVLLLSDSLQIGGLERQILQTVKYLPPNIDRQVWSLEHEVYEQPIQANNIRVTVNERRFQWDFSPAFHLYSLINDYKPDLIHSWGWMSTIAAIPICKIKHIPLIDGTIRSGMKPLRRTFFQQIGLRFADGIIANSMAGLKAWNIPLSKGQVVYNGFDPDRLKLIDEKNDHHAKPFTVGMVSRMSYEKDYDSFITAAEYIVKNTDTDINFIAVGVGELREKVIQRANYLLERKRIQFPSPTLEVIPIVNNFDIGILMSDPKLHAEGCSNAIMEYMVCGLPVICSAGGGNAELVLDGKTGYIVPAGDWKALAEKIIYLYQHPDLRYQFGKEGCRRIFEDFSNEKMINTLLEYYSRFV